MNEKEFYEREYFIDNKGRIYDNSLNENLEDNYLNVSEKKIREIYNNQSEEVREVLENEEY